MELHFSSLKVSLPLFIFYLQAWRDLLLRFVSQADARESVVAIPPLKGVAAIPVSAVANLPNY